jgi:hypothetical protein
MEDFGNNNSEPADLNFAKNNMTEVLSATAPGNAKNTGLKVMAAFNCDNQG